MPTLNEQIDSDIKTAMKSGQRERLGTLRMLKSAIKYAQIEKKLDAMPDADVMAVVQKQIKQRRDAIDSYRQANREDLLKKEEAELVVLQGYLPQAMSAEEVEGLVKAAIQETGAKGKAQIGLVMRAALAKAAGRADGKTINSIAVKLLG
ncbi:MAG: GatB/YqeY domain-containing protein [Verrucomicrobiae bacterium]|nr:GatB/YqeY domain-containing protein [Verrucomicrobiae bacterium]